MEMALVLKYSECLTKEDKSDIEKQIEKIIETHKGNSYEINRLVFDSVTALTTSEARANELADQGMFKRFLGGLTGKNQRIQSEIDNGLARAQYASQQTLQKLAEQNLMSFELITAVNNKLNSSILEIEGEINNIYEILVTFFKQTKSDIIQIENRVERLEKNVNLLTWVNTIEYQMYKGIQYVELERMEKIVCIATDFYSITKGIWTTLDLLLLKSALSEIGLSVKENISYNQFIQYVSEDRDLISKLIQDDLGELVNVNINELSIIKGLAKVKLLESDEEYIVNTVKKQLMVHGIGEEDKNLRYSIVENYIARTAFIDVNFQINVFDFILELLLNIKICEYVISQKYNKTQLDFNSMELEAVKKYAEKGNIEALNRLGNIYHNGEDIECDYGKAVKWYMLSAEKGNAEAQYRLGNIYDKGKDIERDYEKAVKWYKLSAEQGYANAQYSLGDMYYFEKGVDKDYKEAVNWYIKSANQENAGSQYSLGYMYEYGQGVRIDYSEAIMWYRLSAEKGNGNALYRLANFYYNGNIVAKNLNVSIEYYKRAAEYGDSKAQNFLGWCYINGEGVVKDNYLAFKWYKASAEQGNSQAQYRTGLRYFKGEGVAQNKEEALVWFRRSSDQKYEDAKNFITNNY